MNHTPIEAIKISLAFKDEMIPVGRLAQNQGRIYFEYNNTFLETGLDISPLKCPRRPGLQTFDRFLFEGLPGVFYDSLPDGWGRLLLDRHLRLSGILPDQLSPLDRLAYVGHKGMGALVYEPELTIDILDDETINLDQLAIHTQAVLSGEAEDVLQELIALNGSSAGARPKAMINLDTRRQTIMHSLHPLQEGFAPWLVKFPNTSDGYDAGAIEYVYALMAKEAGLELTDIHLFPAKKGAGYFATKRFDRNRKERFHLHSACGLLHSDFRTPALDYEDLIALTMKLTHDIRDVEKMFRLSVFNVLAHNRDDHAKNFSFLMDRQGHWRLSPAYDLTFTSGPNGEQSTMVMGEGKNPTIEHLIKLGLDANLTRTHIDTIIDQTKSSLNNWRNLATTHGVTQTNINLIANKLQLR